MTRPAALDVWLYGTLVARLTENARGGLDMQWTAEATQRWPLNSSVLSVLLLMSRQPPHPARVRAFFSGLMPEGDARTRLAFEAGVNPDDLFGMLTAYGRDVAGALEIHPEGTPEPTGDGELRPISEEAIREKLLKADTNAAPLGVIPGINSISLAGMQPKIALSRGNDGVWHECVDGAPSTHILKPGRPPDSIIADLIHNEAFCLALARHLGLTTIQATVEIFAGHEALVVSRYDRVVLGDKVSRRHQEDCAQMLGLNTDDPARKFQYGARLPSLRRLADIFTAEVAPKLPLLELTTLNVAIGNTDAHAKNISVLHHHNGTMTLAPAYDISPHRHYPTSGRRAAMDVNGLQNIDAITADDLVAEAVTWGFKADAAHDAVTRLLTRTLTYLEDSPPGDKVAVQLRSRVPDRVLTSLRSRTKRLISGLPAAES
jgi:serine/threonine-protein kinase HipA